MKRVLELFSGTGSVSRVCEELGYEVVSVDISNKYHQPTILGDIMTWDYSSQYQPGHFDIIWASPPCNTFSFINLINSSPSAVKEKCERVGLPLLRKTEEIIDYFQPPLWIIENPLGYMKNYITNRPLIICDYCRYSDWGYRKRTCLWTNHPTFQGLKCNYQCNNLVEGTRKHKTSVCSHVVDGVRDKPKHRLCDRYRVPPLLIKELLT
jgi:hypothetical protein